MAADGWQGGWEEGGGVQTLVLQVCGWLSARGRALVKVQGVWFALGKEWKWWAVE